MSHPKEYIDPGITLKSQNEFNIPEPIHKANVHRIHNGGKIKGFFSLFRPSSRGPEKFIAAGLTHQQLF